MIDKIFKILQIKWDKLLKKFIKQHQKLKIFLKLYKLEKCLDNLKYIKHNNYQCLLFKMFRIC